jgi:hypothetical protein
MRAGRLVLRRGAEVGLAVAGVAGEDDQGRARARKAGADERLRAGLQAQRRAPPAAGSGR